MSDRENVIKGLEYCTTEGRNYDFRCPYNGEDDCEVSLEKDALALLKEQEAKPPAIMQDSEGIWSTCSTCGHKLRPILAIKMNTYIPKFCPECGRKRG